ncbi:MAG: AraC family transcriptional regulator [Gemmatimonadota bacterium]
MSGEPDGSLGSKVRAVSLHNLVVTEARYDPDLALPSHAHERATFCIVLGGGLTERLGRETHPLSRFDLMFKPADVDHSDTYGAGGAHCLVVELVPRWLTQLSEHGRIVDAPVHFPAAKLDHLAADLYREFYAVDAAAPLALEATCLELLVLVSRLYKVRRGPAVPSWLREVRDRLHDCLGERVDLGSLAAVAGVHPVYLAQRFRQVYGVTIGDYFRTLRINGARRQLLDTNRPLAEIAVTSGFYDQSHFNRAFRRSFGESPGVYRESRKAVS